MYLRSVAGGVHGAGSRRALPPFWLCAVALCLVSAIGCDDDDVTTPEPLDLSGTYAVTSVVEASACAPQPRSESWLPGFPVIVGTTFTGTWEVEHSGTSLTIRDVPPEPPHPDDVIFSATVTLQSDLTFALGPQILIDGTITTDDGDFDLMVWVALQGMASAVGGVHRINVTREVTEQFMQEGGPLITSCVTTFFETAVRSSG